MAQQIITTTEDFRTQEYSNSVNQTVAEPEHTIDPSLSDLFDRSKPLILRYAGVSVLARQFNGFPDATLSHYAVSKFLREKGIRPKSFIDFGSGVGFNGNYASVHLGAEEIFFSDLYPQAMQHALAAYQLNHGIDPATSQVQRHSFGARVNTGMHTLDLRVGDARQTMSGIRADCATAAPMFIPGVCEVWPQAFETFEGLASSTGTPLYIGHSNLSLPQIRMAQNISGRKLETHEVALVPLRLEYSDDSKTSRTQKESHTLVPEVELRLRGLGLEIRNEPGKPRYYHKLMVSELSGG